MNYLDIILAIPLIWSVYRGFTKGLIISVATLVALVGGIYGAIHFSQVAAVYLENWFSPDPRYLPLIAFTVTFIVIVALVHLLAYILDKIVTAVALGIVNRLAGAAFNLLKMAFILSVILSLLNYLGNFKSVIPEEQKSNSLLYNPISKFAPSIFPYLNFDSLKEKITDENVNERNV